MEMPRGDTFGRTGEGVGRNPHVQMVHLVRRHRRFQKLPRKERFGSHSNKKEEGCVCWGRQVG